MDYTNYSSRWTYPELYYKVSYHFGLNGEISIDFLMIDTIVLCGNTIDVQGSSLLNWIFAKHKAPEVPEDIEAANRQWAWIEQHLAASKSDYLFVVGHYPVYSISEHGPIKCLIDRLDPLLRKYNVSAYFSGHDHNLQHIKLEQQENGVSTTMNYIVSGAGSRTDRSIKNIHAVPADALLFRYPSGWNPFSAIGFSNGAFIHVEARQNKSDFIFYSGTLEEKYRVSLSPRNK
uniref:Calcineurin-like phosphoesterase domain-containing protein n=1 Tax=Acrobeloides nanus TaxID=290746 RepID=A0A914BU86_9BILA